MERSSTSCFFLGVARRKWGNVHDVRGWAGLADAESRGEVSSGAEIDWACGWGWCRGSVVFMMLKMCFGEGCVHDAQDMFWRWKALGEGFDMYGEIDQILRFWV